MSDFGYIQQHYKVPACVGRRVEVYGRPGVIVQDLKHYIGVNFDDEEPGTVATCHPSTEVTYLGMGPVRPLPTACGWFESAPGIYNTECGHSFHGSPEGFVYCHFCGGKVRETPEDI